MKLTIFGATGRTGRHVVEQALERGHEVTAFARSPHKLAAYQERIEMVEGDVGDAEAVARAVAGADAVLSVLGPTENRPDYQVSKGTGHILAAMKRHGVERLVVSAGAGVSDPQDEPKLLNKVMSLLLRTFSGHVFEDMKRTVAAVRDSDVAWTVVRVPRLREAEPKGEVKVGYVGKGMGVSITHADMASFMLDQLDSEAYLHKAPAISN